MFSVARDEGERNCMRSARLPPLTLLGHYNDRAVAWAGALVFDSRFRLPSTESSQFRIMGQYDA